MASRAGAWIRCLSYWTSTFATSCFRTGRSAPRNRTRSFKRDQPGSDTVGRRCGMRWPNWRLREDHTPASAVRLGVCQYLLGRYELAIETLQSGDGGALAHFYMAQAHQSLRRFDAGDRQFRVGQAAGYDPGQCDLGIAEAQRYAGERRGGADGRWTTCPVRWSRRPAIFISGARPWRRWAAIRRKCVRSTSARWKPMANTPGRCSDWRWKTIVAATTRSRWSCTSVRRLATPATSAR